MNIAVLPRAFPYRSLYLIGEVPRKVVINQPTRVTYDSGGPLPPFLVADLHPPLPKKRCVALTTRSVTPRHDLALMKPAG
ncbi:MAG: hypothetical protein AB7Q00_14810 [Phycisphaerales bacterium]